MEMLNHQESGGGGGGGDGGGGGGGVNVVDPGGEWEVEGWEGGALSVCSQPLQIPNIRVNYKG